MQPFTSMFGSQNEADANGAYNNFIYAYFLMVGPGQCQTVGDYPE